MPAKSFDASGAVVGPGSALAGPVECSLTLIIGDRMTKLECHCAPGSEYPAANALMEQMRTGIKTARNRELAGNLNPPHDHEHLEEEEPHA
jgi:hypothetical protein